MLPCREMAPFYQLDKKELMILGVMMMLMAAIVGSHHNQFNQ